MAPKTPNPEPKAESGSKTIEEKMGDLSVALSKHRSPLALAFLEDEAVRIAAEKNAEDYVLRKEKEDSGMPEWMWYLLFFLLGMLFCMSITPMQNMITDLMKLYQ